MQTIWICLLGFIILLHSINCIERLDAFRDIESNHYATVKEGPKINERFGHVTNLPRPRQTIFQVGFQENISSGNGEGWNSTSEIILKAGNNNGQNKFQDGKSSPKAAGKQTGTADPSPLDLRPIHLRQIPSAAVEVNNAFGPYGRTERPDVAPDTKLLVFQTSTTPSLLKFTNRFKSLEAVKLERIIKNQGGGVNDGAYAINPTIFGVNSTKHDRSRESSAPSTIEGSPRLRVPQKNEIRFVVNVAPLPTTNTLLHISPAEQYENAENKTREHEGSTVSSFLSILKETNKLPKKLTPDNIDSGIKTLTFILEKLQEERQSQPAYYPTIASTSKPSLTILKHKVEEIGKLQSFPALSGTSTPGRPGIDYPTYSTIPQTKFDCSTQRYKGFFGDPDTKCQVWHYCDLNGGQASFLCPNGTIFSQVALTCDWWFNVKCSSTSQLYVLNERLYKYILPFAPSFPEDYSGPVVDRYLTAKFNEMEKRSKTRGFKSSTTSAIQEKSTTT